MKTLKIQFHETDSILKLRDELKKNETYDLGLGLTANMMNQNQFDNFIYRIGCDKLEKLIKQQ